MMSGRVERSVGRHAGRQLAGTACALVLTVMVGLGAAHGQEMSGVASAQEPAGTGTGDAVAAFDPTAAGMHSAGEGASLLATLGETPAPFDIKSTRRRPNPAQSAALGAALAMQDTAASPVASEPIFPAPAPS
ncbi:MAG TPA: hypothetical protein VIQ29_11915, partial [Ancylobacter sp.]